MDTIVTDAHRALKTGSPDAYPERATAIYSQAALTESTDPKIALIETRQPKQTRVVETHRSAWTPLSSTI